MTDNSLEKLAITSYHYAILANARLLNTSTASIATSLSLIQKMKASISTKYFIKFLKLFGEEGTIDALQIGDTMYKREGWIDKSILEGNHTIEGILALSYDFNGIQSFVGNINEHIIQMTPRNSEKLEFIVEADKSKLREIEYLVIEQNAYNPGLFEFKYLKEY